MDLFDDLDPIFDQGPPLRRRGILKERVLNGIKHRYCSRCRKFLLLEHFYKRTQARIYWPGRHIGLQSYCKECANKQT